MLEKYLVCPNIKCVKYSVPKTPPTTPSCILQYEAKMHFWLCGNHNHLCSGRFFGRLFKCHLSVSTTFFVLFVALHFVLKLYMPRFRACSWQPVERCRWRKASGFSTGRRWWARSSLSSERTLRQRDSRGCQVVSKNKRKRLY